MSDFGKAMSTREYIFVNNSGIGPVLGNKK